MSEYNEWKRVKGYKRALISGDAIAILWSVEDVICCAEELGFSLTNEQARDVLSDMRQHHDAYIGINWDLIGEWVSMYDSNLMLDGGQGLPRVKICEACAAPTLRCTC